VEGGRTRQEIEGLEDEPDLPVAYPGERVVAEPRDFLALSQYSPELGVSRQPSRFIRVDLPEPDGPMMATYSLG
jgi:hypothetical protein